MGGDGALTEAGPLPPAALDAGDRAAFKATVARGAAVATVAQWLGLLLNFASTIVLARILEPADYGVLAMATAVVGLAWVFQDLGLSQATVQAGTVDHGQLSALFWLGTAFSALVAVAIALSASAVAAFYREPSVAAVMAALAGTCLLAGLGAQHRALLARQLRLTAVSLIGLFASLVALVTGIALAAAGAGYWALAAMYLVSAACTTAGYWIVQPWRPAWPRPALGLRPLIRFGGALSAVNVLDYLARTLDGVLIGRVWGPEALGLYSRAYAMMLAPLNQFQAPVGSVTVPALTRVRDDPVVFRRVFLRALSAVAFATIPVLLAVAALSRDLVLLLFGSRWLEAAPIVSALAVAGVVRPLTSATGWLYLALGRADRMARWGGVFTAVLAGSFLTGLPWGPLGVAVGYAVGMLLLVFPAIAAACRDSPISPSMFIGVAARPALLGLVFAVGSLLPRLWLPAAVATLHGLTWSILGGGGALLAVIAASPAIRKELGGVLALVRLATRPAGPGARP